MGFPRQEYWSGSPFPSPGDLPNPRTEPTSPVLACRLFTNEPPGKPHKLWFLPKSLSSASLIMKSITNLWRPSPRLSTVSLPASYTDTVGKPTKDHREPRLVKMETRKSPGPSPFHSVFPALKATFILCCSLPLSWLFSDVTSFFW